jgi:hypothetical protein
MADEECLANARIRYISPSKVSQRLRAELFFVFFLIWHSCQQEVCMH